MAKLVAVVAEATPEGMAQGASRALAAGADLVEFRLDALPQASLPEAPDLARAFGPRAIATLRSGAEGGTSRLPLGDRLRALRELAQAGFAYVDAELRGDAPVLGKLRDIAHARGTELVASAHAPGSPEPREVGALLRSACAAADVGKVVVDAPTVGRALELMEVARGLGAEGRRFCLIGAGDGGTLTRLHAGSLGCEFNYVVPPGGRATAPGQLDLGRAQLLAQPGATLLGLVGWPLGRSPSPAMHTAALDHLGIPGIYLPLPTQPRELERVLGSLPDLGLRGVNVTAPHKVAALDHLDALDPEAKAVGAVNTIAVGPGGDLVGHNTDTHGFRALLVEASVGTAGRRALLLGAGGGARAVAHVLVTSGAQVAVHSRSPDRARALALQIPGVRPAPAPEDLGAGPWDIVVHCAPPEPGAFGGVLRKVLGPGTTAIDLAYDPMPTPFLREAHRRGCRPVGGLGMLVHQGARALELWLGRPAPLQVMRRAAMEALG